MDLKGDNNPTNPCPSSSFKKFETPKKELDSDSKNSHKPTLKAQHPKLNETPYKFNLSKSPDNFLKPTNKQQGSKSNSAEGIFNHMTAIKFIEKSNGSVRISPNQLLNSSLSSEKKGIHQMRQSQREVFHAPLTSDPEQEERIYGMMMEKLTDGVEVQFPLFGASLKEHLRKQKAAQQQQQLPISKNESNFHSMLLTFEPNEKNTRGLVFDEQKMTIEQFYECYGCGRVYDKASSLGGHVRTCKQKDEHYRRKEEITREICKPKRMDKVMGNSTADQTKKEQIPVKIEEKQCGINISEFQVVPQLQPQLQEQPCKVQREFFYSDNSPSEKHSTPQGLINPIKVQNTEALLRHVNDSYIPFPEQLKKASDFWASSKKPRKKYHQSDRSISDQKTKTIKKGE